jgi:histidinol-phosphatase
VSPSSTGSAAEGERRDLVQCAEAFARHAGDVTRRYFGGKLRAEVKPDGTPITDADREAETVLRDDILARFPEHGVVGEEFGVTNPDARIRWIIDPIDGTRSFMRGVPLYGVLLGIEVDNAPVVGVAHFPALSETVVAAKGLGCRWNGQPARVSDVDSLDQAALLTTDLSHTLSDPACSGFAQLADRCAFARTWGDCYGHILVATGRADIMVDPELHLWDAGPLLTILTEAGGRFTSVAGDARIDAGSGVSTNGVLHAEALRMLAGR